MYYLPYIPTRATPFVVYSACMTLGANPPTISTFTYIGISKDGGQFATCVNAAVFITTDTGDATITRSKWYLQLTASEMDASNIIIAARDSGTAASNCCVILQTVTQQVSAVPAATASIYDKAVANYQYLHHKRTVTSTRETLYAYDGTTVVGTGTLSDDGTTFTKGAPA